MRALEQLRCWLGASADDVTKPDGPGDGPTTPPVRQSHRRAFAQDDRSRQWTDEPETCEACGRRLLTGELPELFQCDGQTMLVCPLCAVDLAVRGHRVPKPPATEADRLTAPRKAA